MATRAKLPFDPSAFLAKVGDGRSIGKYRKGQIVFSQGDPADSVFYVQRGRVKVAVTSDQGKEAVVAMLKPGDFVGEGALTGQSIRIATATATSLSTLLVISVDEMTRVLHAEHALSDHFITYMLKRNIRIEEDLIDQLFNSSEKRLARALLLLARYGKKDRAQWVLPKISQETLAEMIGTTQSRVNFFMKKFEKLGFIAYQDGLQVNDSLLSVVLHD